MTLTISSRRDDRAPQSVTFDAPRVTLGRSSDCDIQVPYRVISAHHLTFQRTGSRYRFRDEGSTNGTEFDGDLLPPEEWVILEDGSELRIVDVLIECAVESRDSEVEAFTLAETGTMARKMLGDALEQDTEDHAYFELVGGPHRGERFRIPDKLESGGIGSGDDCVVTLPDTDLPDRVAELSFENGSFSVAPTSEIRLQLAGRDLDEARPLRDGDRLSFDRHEMVFRDPLESHLMELEDLGDAPDSRGTTPPESGERLEEASVEESVVSDGDASDESDEEKAVGREGTEGEGSDARPGSDEQGSEPSGASDGPTWGIVETILLVVTVLFLCLAAAILLVTFEVV